MAGSCAVTTQMGRDPEVEAGSLHLSAQVNVSADPSRPNACHMRVSQEEMDKSQIQLLSCF